jgi:hypothetical protein
MQRVQKALEDICPCLFIRVATKSFRGTPPRIPAVTEGDIIIRDPRASRDDLPRELRDYEPHEDAKLYCPEGQRNEKTAETGECVCDCYEENRAGCNLLLTLARSTYETALWDDPPGGGGNRHDQGQVRWNPGRTHGGRQEDGDSRRATSVGLAHELGHAYHRATNTRGADRTQEEFKTVRAENQVRAEMRRRMERKRAQSRRRGFNDREKEAYDRLGTRAEYALDGRALQVPDPNGPDGAVDGGLLLDCEE